MHQAGLLGVVTCDDYFHWLMNRYSEHSQEAQQEEEAMKAAFAKYLPQEAAKADEDREQAEAKEAQQRRFEEHEDPRRRLTFSAASTSSEEKSTTTTTTTNQRWVVRRSGLRTQESLQRSIRSDEPKGLEHSLGHYDPSSSHVFKRVHVRTTTCKRFVGMVVEERQSGSYPRRGVSSTHALRRSRERRNLQAGIADATAYDTDRPVRIKRIV